MQDVRALLPTLHDHLYEIPRGLPTGIKQVDELIWGLEPTDLAVVGGATSMGKSSWMIGALNGLIEVTSAGVFSLEMCCDLVLKRQLAAEARVSFQRMIRNQLHPPEKDRVSLAVERLSGLCPYYIDDTPRLHPCQMEAKVQEMVSHGVKIVFVDHIHQMPHRDEADIGDIVRELKAVAKQFEIPVVALCQLNRQVDYRENHRPRMSDLRSSGQIEQVADKILLLYRPEYYMERTIQPGGVNEEHAEIGIVKNRNGATGWVNVLWDGETMKYVDRTGGKF